MERPGGVCVWGSIGLLSCLRGWEGPCQRSHSPEWLDKQVPRECWLLSPAASPGRLLLLLSWGTWVSMSCLPALQGLGDTVTQKVFGKNKVEPPGDASRWVHSVAPSPGEGPGGCPGAVTRSWRPCVRSSAARRAGGESSGDSGRGARPAPALPL